MRTVWKYPIPVQGEKIEIAMPGGAEPCAFQMQDGAPIMWACVDPGIPQTIRRFQVIGTGYGAVEDDAIHVGTCQVSEMPPFVVHLFEVPT